MPDGERDREVEGSAAEMPAQPLDPPAGADGAEAQEEAEPAFFEDPGQILKTLLIVGVLIAAIYVLVPKIAGLDDAIASLGDAQRSWIAVALAATVLSFAAYVALFRGVVGERMLHRLDWRESYQITMAGLAATRLFSAGGAGGIVVTYWALRKAGMGTREAACRMVAFLVVLYAVYVFAVIGFGVLLRTDVVPGDAPVSVTIVPAAIAGVLLVLFLLMALIPGDLQRRLSDLRTEGRLARFTVWLAALPETLANGVRTALDFVRHPRNGWPALVGAVGFWAANVMILWASFRSLGVSLPLGEVVIGFFVGMAANLIPAPAGVGAVDGGLIGAFAIFGYPLETVIAAVLIYRLLAFYLPVPPGIIAFFQLRRTVARWDEERARAASGTATVVRTDEVGTS